MIVVRIELHAASTGRVKEIGVMRLANIGGDAERGDYEVRVQRREERELPGVPCDFESWDEPVTRTGAVKAFPRLSYNVWRLVARALLSAFPEEQKGKTTT